MGDLRNLIIGLFVLFCWAHSAAGSPVQEPAGQLRFSELVYELSAANDRGTGSQGAHAAGELIISRLKDLAQVQIQTFFTPVRRHTRSRVRVNGHAHDISPFISNSISPDTIPQGGLTGRVIYVGKGGGSSFNSQKVEGSIVLMDLDSADHWAMALSLGAKAIIYLVDGRPDRFLFEDKLEVSPVNFPRFILSRERAETIFPEILGGTASDSEIQAVLESDLKWTDVRGQNILALVPGVDKNLDDELIIVEAFYDTDSFVPGRSPGADQSCSIASLLELAAYLKEHPPARPILLAATAGRGNSLAGMREMVWTLNLKGKKLAKRRSKSEKHIQKLLSGKAAVQKFLEKKNLSREERRRVRENILDIVRARIDLYGTGLMQLRLEKNPDRAGIKAMAAQRMAYKRLESRSDFTELGLDEQKILEALIPEALEKLEKRIKNGHVRIRELADAQAVKKLTGKRKIQTVISLNLSSRGKGIGAFNQGWLYDIKKNINPFPPYAKLNDILNAAGKEAAQRAGGENILEDTLRPSLQRSWQSRISHRPALGGEVSRLAGLLGITLVSVDDARPFWNTPWDTPEGVDMAAAAYQSRFVSSLIHALSGAPSPLSQRMPKNGFAELDARALFLRQGAVFADAPAPGSMILAFQGPGMFTRMVDEEGRFSIKGVATKKMTLHKVILEGYKFDPQTGRTVWAVDKKKTTKVRYRVKVTRKKTQTDLIMFPCSQTTVMNLFEPRTFNFLTKLQVLDARMDAMPVHYWYSRIDTRSSLINSVYAPPGTRIKLGFSDTLLTKKIILTNGGRTQGEGDGYRVDHTPVIGPTQFMAAGDMWALLNPRVKNLEDKGIRNDKISGLQSRGNKALFLARESLANRQYDLFFKYSREALALAGRIYQHVDTVQKDVLYGVLFYIMLFAPFAFCLERLIFAFINIYKRIAGFTGILLVLIGIIYQVHPAFELAYSPLVVILAFFIVGLSAMVSWIIFSRFENEMKQFQRTGSQGNGGEITLLKAFTASFFMGINNLRRRRLRTFLTCTTLTILTFTIMSFTSVKSLNRHSRLQYGPKAPYQGMLVKQMNWRSLPPAAFAVVENTMAREPVPVTAAPRGWLEADTPTRPVSIPLTFKENSLEARGLLGLSPKEENIGSLPVKMGSGRWFGEDDRYSVIIPRGMADRLSISGSEVKGVFLRLWSIPFKVVGIFDENALDRFRDLDGEPLTPVVFPDEMSRQITEAEMEAMESGDDIKSFQSRYTHTPAGQTLIIPYQTLISMGGQLKSIALKTKDRLGGEQAAITMLEQFGLWVFSGEADGVFVYSSGDSLNYSGLPNILVPILISMIIVFNTMVASVQERKQEIGIYTSIGMAPSHVSVIFIAEALAYGVLSVVMGYLLAQVVVTVFAGTSLMTGLTANYSSLGGVFAMVLVMTVVLLSSIYPSRVAAAIAIPDVEKSWEPVMAKGDTLDIGLPFLIKENEHRSVSGFLYHIFDEHRAVSHGIFSVGRLVFGTGPENAEEKGIRFTAWLAPFDLGVMQDVEFQVTSSDRFKGYLNIRMVITRKSGEQNTWWRINKRFVNLIRKQLLIWRALSPREKVMAEQYLDEQYLDTERIG